MKNGKTKTQVDVVSFRPDDSTKSKIRKRLRFAEVRNNRSAWYNKIFKLGLKTEAELRAQEV